MVDGAAAFHVFEFGQFARVDAQRGGGHLEHFHQIEIVFGFEAVEIGFVLEDVDVDGVFGQGFVGGNVVGVFGEGNGVALFFQRGLDLVFDHVGEVARGGAEADFGFVRGGGRAAGRAGSGRAAGLSAAGGKAEAEGGGEGEFCKCVHNVVS